MSRFIPACAGNTISMVLPLWWPQVHPRMRGEYLCPFCQLLKKEGSSPHARGILVDFTQDLLDLGFIPACAGNTLKKCSTNHVFSFDAISFSFN